MKATITENGVLIVKSETPLESYTLKMWCKNAEMKDGNFDSKYLLVNAIVSSETNND